ncbi:DUF3347 domain-containing protein [Brumimicrobium glaciale]|uniref:DUF3347 domain-containing protein n=1 Tax=Brumimicrobium glaciale TaxID=200475 RepID=A0A4Q4KJ97_9FLAO|nr:DUF3347 domain-containing protein [Brumimicrobium glaciale]RYM33255.1 DUF3347 domain-containing protein [Brumimicrobium glaciale]
MKKVNFKVISVIIAGGLFALTSCGGGESTTTEKPSQSTEQVNSSEQEEDKKKEDNLSSILSSYFEMSENLTNDSAAEAAKSSKKLRVALKDFQGADLSNKEYKEVDEIMKSSIEHAEHITENAGDIHHQREHLVMLSLDMKDLIEIVGTDQKVYEAYCPMANNNKGAIWITNKNVVENPYMGQSMPKCGKINGEIK